MPKRYTVTAALPYTNGPIHIGHLAGVYVPADIYTRYLRCQGKDILFICGSDEHGVAISLKAKKEGSRSKMMATSASATKVLFLKLCNCHASDHDIGSFNNAISQMLQSLHI